MKDILVQLNNLSLKQEKKTLVKGLSLSLFRGQRIGITGPSGCGKTTILKEIIETSFSQKINKNIDLKKEINISYIPQSKGLLPWYSLRMNLNVFANNQNESKKIANIFNLSNQLEQFPVNLSGGEYQRGVLALATLNKPDLYIADEPLTQLDLQNKLYFLNFWSQEIQAGKASLLMVSHDIETLALMCDKIIVLSDKPSDTRGVIEVKKSFPREKDFLVSEEYVRIKKELLSFFQN